MKLVKGGRDFAVVSILISVSAMVSIWLYRFVSRNLNPGFSAQEKEQVVSCLAGGFDRCKENSLLDQVLGYSFLSADKIALILISFLVGLLVLRLVGTGDRKKFNLRYLCFLAVALFLCFLYWLNMLRF